MSGEQRKHPRVPFTAKVQIRTPALEKLAEEFAGNLSLGGIFIKTAKPLEVGTEVLLIVSAVPVETPVLEARGRVAWTRPRNDPDSGEPAGMGIEFTSMTDASRAVLRSIVGGGGPRAA